MSDELPWDRMGRITFGPFVTPEHMLKQLKGLGLPPRPITADDVRRIIREELQRAGLVTDKGEDI